MAVMSVISEWPNRVRKIFLTDKFNKHGYFALRIYKNGIYHEVIVDDFFPC